MNRHNVNIKHFWILLFSTQFISCFLRFHARSVENSRVHRLRIFKGQSSSTRQTVGMEKIGNNQDRRAPPGRIQKQHRNFDLLSESRRQAWSYWVKQGLRLHVTGYQWYQWCKMSNPKSCQPDFFSMLYLNWGWEYRIVDESRRSFLGFMPCLSQNLDFAAWNVPFCNIWNQFSLLWSSGRGLRSLQNSVKLCSSKSRTETQIPKTFESPWKNGNTMGIQWNMTWNKQL